jgi:DNA-binding CsgD family transcriptional regulator
MALQEAEQNLHGMGECLIGFAALALAHDLPAAAARLLAATSATPWGRSAAKWPATQMEYEQTLRVLRSQLTEAEFDTEQAKGVVLSLHQAVKFALNLPIPGLKSEPDTLSSSLTERQREIMSLIASGLSNGEIAEKLVLSKRTVEKHIANILAKLELSNRVQIVRYVVDNGL